MVIERGSADPAFGSAALRIDRDCRLPLRCRQVPPAAPCSFRRVALTLFTPATLSGRSSCAGGVTRVAFWKVVMTRFPCPYLKGDVELTTEREEHIEERQPAEKSKWKLRPTGAKGGL